ncbi:MAG: SGNH/GDSL hydrolase family protein [Planctomycetaceae bacterium]|nr:SGNH/GDSL hydrolase family protein [Planctomycetaceae bacterium]
MQYKLSFLFIIFLFIAVPQHLISEEVKPLTENDVDWYDTTQWKNEGRAFDDTTTPFTRLPKRAEDKVTKSVWGLSGQSAGIVVRFKTDGTKIIARHEIGNDTAMEHMTKVGSAGLDLYAKDQNGKWRWAGFSKPNAKKYESIVLSDVSKEMREYMLYLPLYNATISLSIGVPAGSKFEAVQPLPQKPIVYYGSSITQGCSASRPGMTVPAILGRRFNLPVINFGFSGNAKMEKDLAQFIAEKDASVYIIDALPNMQPEQVKERAEIFLREVRKARPDTPLLLVEDRTNTNAWLKPQQLKTHAEKRKYFREAFDKLTAEEKKNISYVPADGLLGDDDEGTVDSSHPSDLGMFRMAEVLIPYLAKLMERTYSIPGAYTGNK